VRKVSLILGDPVIEAREGEKLEQGFRVQSVTAEAVTLVYEPLDMPVTMALVFQDIPAPSVTAAGTTPAAAGSTKPSPQSPQAPATR
jgi:hypothetical protein